MDSKIKKKLSNFKIKRLTCKIISGSFGDNYYFGYNKSKLIGLIKIQSKNFYGLSENIIGTYSPKILIINVQNLENDLKDLSIVDALNKIEEYKKNKFFFYQGVLKSIISSIEISIYSLLSDILKKSLADVINDIKFSGKLKKKTSIPIYSSAGSINSTIEDLKNDINNSKKLNIDRMKIRINLDSNKYQEKIKILDKSIKYFAIDLISNTYEKNSNLKKINIFLKFIKKYKPLWIEEILNVNDLKNINKLNRKNILLSYGENFNSSFDFLSIMNLYNFDYINIDIGHCSIDDIFTIINHLKKNKKQKKIIFHCWGSLLNLITSLEIASLVYRYTYMVEFPLAKFKLNDFYLNKFKIRNSEILLDNDLEIIKKTYNKTKSIKNFDQKEFKF